MLALAEAIVNSVLVTGVSTALLVCAIEWWLHASGAHIPEPCNRKHRDEL